MLPKLIHIRLFVAVYEERSFSMAAQREAIVQSGVSQHIRQLEEQLNVLLFYRQRELEPTPAGHAFYGRCIALLRAHANVQNEPDDFANQMTGTLRVGLIPPVTRNILGSALMVFVAAHPLVKVSVVESTSEDIADQVRRGLLEFGVVHSSIGRIIGLSSSILAASPTFLVSAPDSDLAHGRPLRLNELGELDLILPSSRGPSRVLVENYLIQSGVRVRARLDWGESLLGALDLVRISHWRCFSPGALFSAKDFMQRSYTLNPMEGMPPLTMCTIELASRSMSAQGRAFLDILRPLIHEANAIPLRLAKGENLEQVLRNTAPHHG